jgi:hypothetical protein
MGLLFLFLAYPSASSLPAACRCGYLVYGIIPFA